MNHLIALFAGLILLLPGCQEDGGSGEAPREYLIQEILPTSNKMDVLWVIDNSNSMCQEQEALVEAFSTFVAGLSEINVEIPGTACDDGATCIDPDPTDEGGVNVCTDFEFTVETRRWGSLSDEWTPLPGPGSAEPAYALDYHATMCATGIGIRSTSLDGRIGEGEARVRYR